MGQIVIDIPNGANRRYIVEKADDARKLLLVLDEVLRDPSKLTRQQKRISTTAYVPTVSWPK